MKLRGLTALCLLASLAGAAGCQHNIVRSVPPSVATPPPPPVVEASAPPILTPMPEPRPITPLQPLPPPPAIEAPKPPMPHPIPATAAPQPSRPKAKAPLISPQMTPSDLAQAKRQTNADIAVSERNLQLASGRSLNAAQKDLADKVRGFLEQAHEAIRANDWVRAKNLAQKARILATELDHSL